MTDYVQISKIGIIGGGVSGISALKQLEDFDPILLEKNNFIGGVWRTCVYDSTKLQSPGKDYEFMQYHWADRENPEFPDHNKVADYLESYVDHFKLRKYIKFNSEVVKIRYIPNQDHKLQDDESEYQTLLQGKPVWEVDVQVNGSGKTEKYAFEFLVMCLGKYGDIPRIPKFPVSKGPEIYNGQVIHTIDYCKLSTEDRHQLLKDKKVVVVGFKKSAIDLALECAKANQGPDGKTCTLVIRTLHWTVPHYWIWGLPFYFFFSTRLSQFIHGKPNQSQLKAFFCMLLSPMRHAISKFIESYLLYKMPLEKYGLKPEHPFIEDYASCQMAIMPEEFFPEADKGKISFRKCQQWWFYEGGIEFEDQQKVEADVVIFATGYQGKEKLKIIPKPFSSRLENSDGLIPLYRGTIHPHIPNMAFVGYIESVSNLHTAEVRSMWLKELLHGTFKLPGVSKMEDQISKETEKMKESSRFHKRHCISTFSINHEDEIHEEMGRGTSRNQTRSYN